MNNVSLVGRFTRDMELRYATGENATAILHNCVAVRRKFKNADGEYESDFINITAFGKTAEFILMVVFRLVVILIRTVLRFIQPMSLLRMSSL